MSEEKFELYMFKAKNKTERMFDHIKASFSKEIYNNKASFSKEIDKLHQKIDQSKTSNIDNLILSIVLLLMVLIIGVCILIYIIYRKKESPPLNTSYNGRNTPYNAPYNVHNTPYNTPYTPYTPQHIIQQTATHPSSDMFYI